MFSWSHWFSSHLYVASGHSNNTTNSFGSKTFIGFSTSCTLGFQALHLSKTILLAYIYAVHVMGLDGSKLVAATHTHTHTHIYRLLSDHVSCYNMVSCIDHNPIGNYFSWCQIYLFMLWTMALQQGIWNSSGSEQREEISHEARGIQEQTIGFSIKNAVLFPPEVEKGMWPEDYSLSDHARLTVVFSPIRMPCSQSLSWQTSRVKELRCKTCT